MSELKAVKKAEESDQVDQVDQVAAAKHLIQAMETRADELFAEEYRILCEKHKREIQPITNLVIRRIQE